MFKLGDYGPEWTITLNRYQRDNLVFWLEAAGYCGESIEPFSMMNNGDWIGELYWMLDYPNENIDPKAAEAMTAAEREFVQRIRAKPELQANTTLQEIKDHLQFWLDHREDKNG